MTNHVFVLDTKRKPLTPCKPSMARKLLNAGKAAMYCRYPFTIILKKEVEATPEPITLKLDPGSKVTGFALVQGNQVIFGAELSHRPKGWLAPSLGHRVATTMTWVHKFIKLAPIGSIVQELVRFDLQQLEHPEISGMEYQQGTLQGYEVREYLLNKWERKCAYCAGENLPLQVEHIRPLAHGGSNRISNLSLACQKCNLKKGTKAIEEFLAPKPDVLKRVLAEAKRPLKDAAAVNSTRWALFSRLKATGLPVVTGSGGLTKFNRTRLGLPKTHWLDAASVGEVDSLEVLTIQPLLITAKGWGCRQMVQNDKYGFPRQGYKAKQKVKGWNTGDIVSVISGKFAGLNGKRLKTVRFKGCFDIRLAPEKVISVNRKDLRPVHRQDGYDYNFAQV
jgi:5-methylcytosine-specific restriction endonuclease McrA